LIDFKTNGKIYILPTNFNEFCKSLNEFNLEVYDGKLKISNKDQKIKIKNQEFELRITID
jgi:hypothetical protein